MYKPSHRISQTRRLDQNHTATLQHCEARLNRHYHLMLVCPTEAISCRTQTSDARHTRSCADPANRQDNVVLRRLPSARYHAATRRPRMIEGCRRTSGTTLSCPQQGRCQQASDRWDPLACRAVLEACHTLPKVRFPCGDLGFRTVTGEGASETVVGCYTHAL
jgi:hypothetical protein